MAEAVATRAANHKSTDKTRGHLQDWARQSVPTEFETQIFAMHNAVGNQAVGQIMRSHISKINTQASSFVIQCKCSCGGTCPKCRQKEEIQLKSALPINQPGDHFEREADFIADHVMRRIENENQEFHDVHSVQPTARTPNIMRKEVSSNGAIPSSLSLRHVSPTVTRQDLEKQVSGQPLPENIRQRMESVFGHDFSRIRVHVNLEASNLTQRVGAQAFTFGRDIYFGAGYFNPNSSAGQKLLAHELTHVVQQRASRPKSMRNSITSTGFKVQRFADAKMIQGRFNKRCVRHLTQTRNSPVCLPPPSRRRVGTMLHKHLQQRFRRRPNRLIEVPVPYGGKAPCDVLDPQEPVGSTGKIDLVRVVHRGPRTVRIEIGEIKPLNALGLAAGVHDIYNCYREKVIAAGRNCPNPTNPLDRAFCRRLGALGKRVTLSRRIGVRWSPGRFPFFMGGRRRHMIALTCTRGVIGYRCLERKRRRRRGRSRERATRQVRREARRQTTRQLERQARRQIGRKLIRRGLARFIPGAAYYELAVMVAALSLGARPAFGQEGMSPEEAIIQALRQEGVELSPEVEEIIRQNPELVERIKSASERGDSSEVAREAAQRFNSFLRDHADELGAETIERLLDLTERGGERNPSLAATREDMERMLEAIQRGERPSTALRGGRPGQPSAPSTGEKPMGEEEGEQVEAEAEQQVAEEAEGEQPESATGGQATGAGVPPSQPATTEPSPRVQIPPELRERFHRAPEPVKRLYEAITSKGGEGPQVTAEDLERFLNLVTVDPPLTDEQVDELKRQTRPIEPGITVEQVLESLRQAIVRLRTQLPTEGERTIEPSESDRPEEEQTPTSKPQTGVVPSAGSEGETQRELTHEERRIGRRVRRRLGERRYQRLARTQSITDLPSGTRLRDLRQNLSVQAFFASRRENGILVGGYVRIRLIKQVNERRWVVRYERGLLFDENGDLFLRWLRPVEKELTFRYF